MVNSDQKHSVVVGAGAIGINCALSLLNEGHKVTLVDRDPPGEGCSFGNAGLIARSAFVPLASPGLMYDVPGWLIDPEGPLSIRWSYLPKILPWLWKYIKAGNAGNEKQVADALQNMIETSVDLYVDLAAQAGAPELVIRSSYMYAYESEKSFRKDSPSFIMRRERNVDVEELTGGEIREVEPALSPHYTNAYLVPDHGFTVNPLGLMQALAKLFVNKGGTVVQREVRDIEHSADGKVRIICEGEDIEADYAVIALGAYSRPFAEKLGAPVPLDTERGYHAMIAHPGVDPKMPVMSGDGKFLATPMEHGLRFAGTVEFAGVDAEPNYARSRALLNKGKKMFPGLQTEGYSEWMGRRPTLPDSLPVIGPSPNARNVMFAFGHQHIGLTAGPNTGKFVADLICDRKPNVDLSMFKVERFL